MTTIATVLYFWLVEVGPEKWYVKDKTLDRTIADRFGAAYRRAAAGLCDDWRRSPAGCLALLILLDQFPRNMFRGSCRAFATDAKARRLAHWSLAHDIDGAVDEVGREFLLTPLEHSEELADQELCVRLAAERMPGSEFHDYAVRHRDIIRQFGRFPHRNEVLGRASTDVEAAFLARPGSSF